jgi:hypothetical protein
MRAAKSARIVALSEKEILPGLDRITAVFGAVN